MTLTGSALLLWQYGLPLREVLFVDLLIPIVRDEAPLHSYFRSLVAIEERRVHFDTFDLS